MFRLTVGVPGTQVEWSAQGSFVAVLKANRSQLREGS